MPNPSGPACSPDVLPLRHGLTAGVVRPYALAMCAVRKEWVAGCDGCAARVQVLRGATLRVRFGEIVGITGPPGAGKTTLLLCAAGLLRLDHGTVARHAGWVRYLPADPRPARRLASLAALPPCAGAGHPTRGTAEVAERASWGTGLILLDELPEGGLGAVGEVLRRRAAAGDAVLVASRDVGALGCVGARTVALVDGSLVAPGAPLADQRRKRTAARSSASSPDSRAASRMRSTCDRRLRSPQ